MAATGIEAYCQAHQYTISAFGAVSTFAAVVVSLWLAHRADVANRTRLRASFEVATLLHASLPDRPTFVTVSIVNIGNLPLVSVGRLSQVEATIFPA